MQPAQTLTRSKPVANGTTSARLGGARADFVGGLGRKAADLRATIGRVKAQPSDGLSRDELRRKLHALSSSAKMMKFDAMDRALGESLGILDRSARETALEEADVEAIEQTIADLPALAWGDEHARTCRLESAERVGGPAFRALVVGAALIAEALLEDGPSARARFTCESTPDANAGFDLVRTTEPDLVVLDADVASAADLVEALLDDPLTESVPIVVVGSFLEPSEAARFVALGVTKTVGKPTSRETIRAACEEAVLPARKLLAIDAMLGEPTLEELGDRLASELRDALIGRTDPSARTRRIPLGQGTEVLGAVWGAIARVREIVTSRSDGQIRFSGGPEGAMTPARLLEPDVARGDRSRYPRRGPAAEVSLTDRRVVIVDDDPAVVWFLADLLKTAGCVVHEAFDGQQALELCYETSPDLVISDILMPKLDGFSLCRALRRDLALHDTPVILLSWKEDLLQRVRELGAGAAAYVRKESDTRAIIARAREALRARGRIEARLREDGEVRGRIDGVSMRTLLEIVSEARPNARVSVHDASFLYEVELRDGAPVRATRTDGGGRFLKGAPVLTQLLGVSAGRFAVMTSTTFVEGGLKGNLASQLAKPIARARAATALLTGTQAHAIARVRLDEDGLSDYLEVTPERARLVARRLANGASPHELVVCGSCEPALLDDMLCDLAARGIVVGIEASDGTDLLRSEVKGLLQHADARAGREAGAVTPSPAPSAAEVAAVAPTCADDVSAPLCVSPTPGHISSLADVVLRQVSLSPEPAGTTSTEDAARRESATYDEDTSADAAPGDGGASTGGRDPAHGGTPLPEASADERTAIEGTVYAERTTTTHDEDATATADPTVHGDVQATADVAMHDDVRATSADDEDLATVDAATHDGDEATRASAHDEDRATANAAMHDEDRAAADAVMHDEDRATANAAMHDEDRAAADAVMHDEGRATANAAMHDDDDDDDEASASLESPSGSLTPFASVSSGDAPHEETKDRKRWPMFAFVAGVGLVAWAVLYLSTAVGALPSQNGRPSSPPEPESPLPIPAITASAVEAEPAPSESVVYTDVAPDSTLPADHGVLHVSAPEGAVVLVDGEERSRGSASLPMSSGRHEVRVRNGADDERGCTIGIRSSRVAHVSF